MSLNLIKVIFLLLCSNTLMLFAWYGPLKDLNSKPIYIVVFISWGIALFEYFFQVPANRLGYNFLNLAQLKILQEVITLLIFVPFSIFFMGQTIKLDFLWASFCMLGAVYFIFRS